jgi:glycosyltransferase involved in cell wall biosynthesis
VFSAVIPVYKNERSLPELVAGLGDVGAEIQRLTGQPFEVVFVVDGSPDRSFQVLTDLLASAPFQSQLLLHSRNFGSFSAIRTGLAAALGSTFGVIAADLQEPTELLLEFCEALQRDACDVVIGCREKRSDPPTSRLASSVFWRLYRRFVIPDIPKGGVDVFGCNARFRDELLRLEESNTSLVGLIFWLGFRRREISYSRRERKHGKSAWSFGRKLNYLFDSVFSFTDLPIKLLLFFGFAGLVISLILGLMVTVAKAVGEIPVPGYAATALTVLFFGGLNALGLGIVGTYAWRGFENTKGRPLGIVRLRRSFGGSASTTIPGEASRPRAAPVHSRGLVHEDFDG